MRLNQQQKRSFVGFMFTLPWLVGAIAFFAVPMVLSFLFSIFKVDPINFEFSFIGFEQYKWFFLENAVFVPNLVESIRDMLLSVVMVMFFSLFIANILAKKFKGSLFFKTVFFLPFIIATSLVIHIIMGDIAIDSEQSQSTQLQLTVFRNLLNSANINADISSVIEKMLNGMLNIAWKCGLQIIIFMTGLQNISTSIKEAANIEGATGWEYFWKIAFPLISPIFQLNLIYSIIDSFTDYSNTMIGWIDNLAFSLEITASSTLACLYYGIIFLIIGIVFLLIRKRVFYYVD